MEKWYNRFYEQKFPDIIKAGKVLLIYGPRRAGKTSLIKHFLLSYKDKYFSGVGEDMALRELMRSQDVRRITSSFKGYQLVVIDEAQKIPGISTGLKILVDNLPQLKIIASGSSSFKLSSQLGEPLTGRYRSMFLYPLAMLELHDQFGGMDILEQLEEFLVFGTYPEVMLAENHLDKQELLVNLRDSYLFKDILELDSIRNADKLSDLLKLLAFQIGKEVSLTELGSTLGLAKQTVERYLELLEKTFVIRKVRGFSRNLRKEIAKSSRYYFLDNGIRNALINNFNNLSTRNDTGMLWENFLFVERMKKRCYSRIFANDYFWRTYDQQEIDLVEEREGRLWGYEFKWGKKRPKIPKAWLETYENAQFQCINKDNFLDFIT
jgi:predicted AAA+ superfamily ATPase